METDSEYSMDALNNEYLSLDYNFFPITGLQVGKWLSAFHSENQLFIYHPSPEKLVFLALHSESNSHISSPYFLTYTRKELLKMCKNSPFTAPVSKKNASDLKESFLKRINAEYGGIVAFEINLKNIEGFDYSNTLFSYGSRITLEVNKAKKLWFSNANEFCKYYEIYQTELNTKYYSPVLDGTYSFFKPKQVNPKGVSQKKAKTERLISNGYCANTPDSRVLRHKPRRSVSEVNFEGFKLETKSGRYEKDFHESEFCHFTISAYFDDPIFPYFVKNLLKKPENKYLLTMYERGIPSWAQFLPSYGLPYRPWMRRAMAVIIFLFSLITMLLGFYDLYKKIPLLRSFLSNWLGDFFTVFEEAVVLRLSVLLGYIITSSQLFRDFITNLFSCGSFFEYLLEFFTVRFSFVAKLVYQSLGSFGVVVDLMSSLKSAVVKMASVAIQQAFMALQLKQVFFFMIRTIFFILSETVALVLLFIQEIKDLVSLSLSLPFDIVYGITYAVWDVFYELFSDFYTFFSSIVKAFRYLTTIFKSNQNALSISETVGIFETIKEFWYEIFRHVLRGITSIYHFVVYTTYNIYKHKDSMWVSAEINYLRFMSYIRNRIMTVKIWLAVYVVLLVYLKLKFY